VVRQKQKFKPRSLRFVYIVSVNVEISFMMRQEYRTEGDSVQFLLSSEENKVCEMSSYSACDFRYIVTGNICGNS